MARINPWLLFGLGAAGVAWFATRAKAATPGAGTPPGSAAYPGVTPIVPTPAQLALNSSTNGQSFTAGNFPGVAAAPGTFDPNNPLGLGSWLD